MQARILGAITLVVATCTGCATPRGPGQDEVGNILPVPVVRVIPVSASVQNGIDFTPGLAGLVMNVLNVASTVRQINSDKFRLIYLEKTKPLLQDKEVCLQRSIEFDYSPELGNILPGDYVTITKNQVSQYQIVRVKRNDGEVMKIGENEFCYATYAKLMGRTVPTISGIPSPEKKKDSGT